jgi:hypothetical protein
MSTRCIVLSCFLVALSGTPAARPAHQQPGGGPPGGKPAPLPYKAGFALAEDMTGANYSPNAANSVNPAGGAITITRTAPGTYAVRFAGLGGNGKAGGNVQVTPYGASRDTAQIVNWDSAGQDFVVNIRYFNASGQLADGRYSVTALWPQAAGNSKLGFAWADNQTAANYAPDFNYAHNSSGGAITVTRSAMGTYKVVFAGLGGNGKGGGNVQATGYGQSGERAQVDNWDSAGADFVVNVRCLRPDGSMVDARFSLLVVWP